MLIITFIGLSFALASVSSLDVQQCPLWTSPQNGSCKCGTDLRGIVKCEDGRGAYALSYCFCMTTEDNLNLPVVGSCLYECRISRTQNHIISTNETDELNNLTCGPFNRNGTTCGRCIEDHSLAVYSYNLSCVECTDYKYNWLKYIVVAYGPLTVFYFISIILRVSVTSGSIVSYVTICQTMTTIGLATQLFNMVVNTKSHYFAKLGLTVMSVWNLDFFRSLYPPFCLHPHLSALQVLSLDYIVAVYPMILVLITYLLVKLHDRFRLVVWLCRPAYSCFRHFRKEWDIETSLIGAFATFFLLSYVKILDISAHLLTPTHFYYMNGTHGNTFFFYDSTVPYLGEEHLLYAMLAVTLSLLFNILPLILLCSYPCPCFQRCLNKSKYHFHSLHIFMDAILGCYSHRPRERRHFGAIYLLIRIFHIAAFTVLNPLIYASAGSSIWMLAIITVALFMPYKNKYHNFIDIILFSLIHFSYSMLIYFLEGMFVDPIDTYNRGFVLYSIATYASLSMVMMYWLFVFVWTILPRKSIKTQFAQVSFWKRQRFEDSLPYRLRHNHGERCPLLMDGIVQHYNDN